MPNRTVSAQIARALAQQKEVHALPSRRRTRTLGMHGWHASTLHLTAVRKKMASLRQ